MTTLFVCDERCECGGAESVGRLLCVQCVGSGTGTAERGGGDDDEARSFYERGEQRGPQQTDRLWRALSVEFW